MYLYIGTINPRETKFFRLRLTEVWFGWLKRGNGIYHDYLRLYKDNRRVDDLCAAKTYSIIMTILYLFHNINDEFLKNDAVYDCGDDSAWHIFVQLQQQNSCCYYYYTTHFIKFSRFRRDAVCFWRRKASLLLMRAQRAVHRQFRFS